MRVRTYVTLRGENGFPVVLAPGEAVPVWAQGRISPRLLIAEDVADPAFGKVGATTRPSVPRPATAGRGASLDAWAKYAESVGVVPGPGWSRKEIIAACESLGV